MSIRRKIDSIADRFSNKVDDKLINYVSRFVYDDMDDLENAISIYLCLGDILCYSTMFSLNHDYSKISLVRDISLDNNEMICKNWSILFHRILKYFDISSKVVRTKAHYKVEMVLDDVIYSLDATGYGGNGIYYSISDTTRIKCGLKIDGVLVSSTVDSLDINKFTDGLERLRTSIDKVYERQNRKVIPDDKIERMKYKVQNCVENNAAKVGIGTIPDIYYRIKIINRFWGLNIFDSSVEKIQLFNSCIKYVFDDYNENGYETKCYNIYACREGRVRIYKLIAIEVDDYFYYFLDNGKKFIPYNKKELLEEFRKRNIRISEFTEILGLYVDVEQYRVKMRG